MNLSAKIRKEIDSSSITSVQEYMKRRAQLFEEKSALLVQRVELEQKLVREKNELLKLENDAKELAHTLLQKQMSYAKLEVVVQGKKEELVIAKGEYESLSHQSVELDEFKSGKIDNQLVLQLNEAIKHRDE